MKNQKGFSLVELLVVVIIIAIIAAIAIPSLLASRRAANDAAAVQNLRTIHSAQATYFATDGNTNDYGTWANLTAAPDNLIDNSWADGVTKNTYVFTMTNEDDAYCAQAVGPEDTYSVDRRGAILEGPCAANAATGTAIGTTAPAAP